MLDLYRTDPGPWSEPDLGVAVMLADVAASYLVMAHDREQAVSAQSLLHHQALHDSLTGLPICSMLFNRTEHALAVAERRHTAVALLFLDVDRFKGVNDTLGHAAGDEVLVQIAARVTSVMRKGDTLARLSGDEFVLLCEDLPLDSAGALDSAIRHVSERIAPPCDRRSRSRAPK